MEYTKQYELIMNLYRILKDKTDANNTLSTPELQAELELLDLHADRRTIYKCLDAFKENDIPIETIKKDRKTGHYYNHLFTPAESFVLLENIHSSLALSHKESDILENKIYTLMSENEIEDLPTYYVASGKSKSSTILKNIELLLPAIKECMFVKFRYFDLTAKKTKKYRKNESYYVLTPYAIVSENGKYYCVFYDHKHEGFSNYRLDKMDALRITDEKDTPVSFSLKNHMRDSMQMYHGKPQTVTAAFDVSLASKVFEQFPDLIVSEIYDDYFVANIRTTLSPTLTSWFMLYYDQVKIIKPQSLIDDMLTISKHLQKTYGGKKK